jgi:hypothetical protein
MKQFKTRSLVQVHYHDRLSGVNKVIGLYARAFARLGKDGGANLVLCRTSPPPSADFHPARTINATLCDYRDYTCKSQFDRVKASLVGSLEMVIRDKKVKTPVAIVGHNLSLGKNCGLTAAFAEVARLYADKAGDYRFFSVIHDFAEEGRADCLKRIGSVQSWSDIESDLFPDRTAVGLVTLNETNAFILRKAGYECSVLFDPVVASRGGIKKRLKSGGNRPLSSSAGLRASIAGRNHFQSDLPVILYPSRCISRKNILEAILVCTFIYKSNLMIGASGASETDVKTFKRANALCEKYALPVMFDYNRILDTRQARDVFTYEAFNVADAIITTSLAEGFGYGLYEPWLYGKAVFGRKHLGFEPIAGVRFKGLYDRLPVPMSWIDFGKLRDAYWTVMRRCFGAVKNNTAISNRKLFDRAFTNYFVENGTIDFGCLDTATQFAVIKGLLESPGKNDEWETRCKGHLSKIRKSADAALFKSDRLVRLNCGRIAGHLSLEAFSGGFGKILSRNGPQKKSAGRREDLLRGFCRFERFRLLLGN